MKTIDQIRQHIAKGETEKALELLIQYSKEKNPSLQNDAAILSSRYQQWKRSTTLGIQESTNDLQKIEHSMLTMLEDSASSIPSSSVPPKVTASVPPPQKKSSLMPIILGLLGLGALAMGGFWMFGGDDHHNDHTHNTSTEIPTTSSNEKEIKKADEPKVNVKPVTKPVDNPAVNQPESTPPASKPLPAINGTNVNLVDYGNGFFRNLGGKNWTEESSTLKPKIPFKETGRDDFSVYLHSEKQGMNIQLDLYRKKVTYADKNDTTPRDLYDIKNVYTKIKGMTVKRVLCGDNSSNTFEALGDKKWIEKDMKTGKTIDSFDETGRDEWSVYLTNSGKDIRLDLNLKKVMYNEKGKTLAPLYNINAVY